ncbi:MAG: hypothetical protein AAGE84_20440 [Cyanobacteria bacterium P01_G01_bin.39]
MSFVNQRKLVAQKAKSNSEQAYKPALKISDYWYYTQALSSVARYADEQNIDKFIHRACKASFSNRDPYKVLGSSAWVIRAIIERRKYKYLDAYLLKLLHISSTVSNPVSRADGLFLMYQAIFPIENFEQLQLVLDHLLLACLDMNSWKKPQIMRNIALIMANKDLIQAYKILEKIPGGRVKRQTKKYLSETKFLSPRAFFW